jgi:hypothetical protein
MLKFITSTKHNISFILINVVLLCLVLSGQKYLQEVDSKNKSYYKEVLNIKTDVRKDVNIFLGKNTLTKSQVENIKKRLLKELNLYVHIVDKPNMSDFVFLYRSNLKNFSNLFSDHRIFQKVSGNVLFVSRDIDLDKNFIFLVSHISLGFETLENYRIEDFLIENNIDFVENDILKIHNKNISFNENNFDSVVYVFLFAYVILSGYAIFFWTYYFDNYSNEGEVAAGVFSVVFSLAMIFYFLIA